MNRKKAVWFYLALAIGSAALFAGCDAVMGLFGLEEDGETSAPVNPPVDRFDPSVASFYVSSTGDDTNTGTDETAPLATLAAAYDKALASTTGKRIVVLSDLSEAGLVTLTPDNKPVGGGGGFILIEGRRAGLKIERSTGANDSVLQIQDGAKITCKNITVNGKIAPENDNKNANNRAILIDGDGTEVLFRAGAVATGKTYLGSADIDSNNHGCGIRVINKGKLVMESGSAVTGCEGVGYVNGAIQLNEGLLEMKRGSRVYGNSASFGGGVEAYKSSAVTMYGGEISGNRARMKSGGGVHIQRDTVFTMHGGIISGNETVAFGGGISTGSSSAVTIKGGKISGNHSVSGGGGIEVFRTAFAMEGGEISGNTSDGDGGGVYLSNDTASKFKMIGGVVYGAEVQAPKANAAGQGKTGAALYKSTAAVLEVSGIQNTTETTIDKR
jgi:hypothetical protein